MEYMTTVNSRYCMHSIIRDPFHLHVLTSMPTCKIDYIHRKAWCEITYPNTNVNDATFEFWKWICNCTPHITRYVTNHLLSDQSYSMLVKWAPGTSIPWADLHLGVLSQKQVPRAGTNNCIPYVVLDVYTCPCLQYTYFPLYLCMDIYF